MTELNLGLLLFIPYRSMENRVFDALRASGFDDFTPAQARLFQRVDEGGTRLTALAERAQVTKQTAGFLVDQLERAGYVERVADPRDARARLITIAPRGRAAVVRAAEVVAETEADWAAHLGEETMATLRTALTRLREITDPYA